jgi:urease accessory protein
MHHAIATFTQRFPSASACIYQDSVTLTAEERQRSRYPCTTDQGTQILLALPRGTVLHAGDYLTTAEKDRWIIVKVQTEPVFRVTGSQPLDILRAAYHLGNRHVPLALAPNYLILSPDPVLKEMLHHLGLTVVETELPFEPEPGAYGHHNH